MLSPRRAHMLDSETEPCSPVLSAATAAPVSVEETMSSGRSKRAVVQGQIGFVGLGRMGKAMAENLVAAGHEVVAYVRRQEQIGPLAALGLDPTTDLADVFDCEFIITMLPDDNAVREIVVGRQDPGAGLAIGMVPGAIHLSMSTISTGTASQLAGEHARYGRSYVAAPVF